MAKKVKATKKPTIFKNGKQVSRKTIDSMRSDILDKLQATAQQVDDVYIKRMPTYLEVTEKKLEEKGVIDLKKAFAKSSKKRRTKNGGWYLIVPIRIKTSRMNRDTYQDMRKLQIPSGKSSASSLTSYLQAVSKGRNITHPSMKPKAPSNNMTKVRRKPKKKASYFIFRTVSSKSPSSAWVLNRDKVNSDNFSKTTLNNVKNLMNWKMRNIR